MVAVVSGLLVGVAANSGAAATSTTVTGNVSGQTTAAVSAKSLLSELTVKADNTSKYYRSNFKHWTDAYMGEIDLSGANLTGANLTNADLTGANLEGATMPPGWQDMVAAY